VKERPIVLDGIRVRSILKGRASVLWWLVFPQPTDDPSSSMPWVDDGPTPSGAGRCGHSLTIEEFPYGVVGDRLWVREPHRYPKHEALPLSGAPGMVHYEADLPLTHEKKHSWGKLRTASQMPRAASRLTVEIAGVQCLRIHNITDRDATACGMVAFTKDGNLKKYWCCDPVDDPCPKNLRCPWSEMPLSPLEAFFALADATIGRRVRLQNPWVWFVDVRRVANG
jgi:hypothetical protein